MHVRYFGVPYDRTHALMTGAVWPESPMVATSSGYPALDSAAVTGSRRLKFRPARLRGHRHHNVQRFIQSAFFCNTAR